MRRIIRMNADRSVRIENASTPVKPYSLFVRTLHIAPSSRKEPKTKSALVLARCTASRARNDRRFSGSSALSASDFHSGCPSGTSTREGSKDGAGRTATAADRAVHGAVAALGVGGFAGEPECTLD